MKHSHSKKENYLNILTAVADATLTLIDTYNEGVAISFKHYSFCYEGMETYYIHAQKLGQEERETVHASVVYRLSDNYVGRHLVEVFADEFTTAKQVADIFATRLAGR